MTTWEEFRKGHRHHVDYGDLGKRILELDKPEKLWSWLEVQDFSEFEKGLAVGFMMTWIEIFVKRNGVVNED